MSASEQGERHVAESAAEVERKGSASTVDKAELHSDNAAEKELNVTPSLESEAKTKTNGLAKNVGASIDCTKILVLINIVVFLCMVLSSGWRTFFLADWDTLLKWGANLGALTVHKEYWRLFTSLFVHSSILHLGLNMSGLWVFGPDVKELYGTMRFLAIYILSGLAAALSSIIWDPTNLSSGASGAILGIIGATLSALFCGRKCKSLDIPPFIFLGIICASLLGGFFYPEIDNAAHVGGFFAGFICGLLLLPILSKNVVFQAFRLAVITVLSIAFFTLTVDSARTDRRSDIYRVRASAMKNLREKKFQDAFNDYDKLLKTELISRFFVGRAESLMGLRQYKKALEDANKAIALDPKETTAFLARARAYHLLAQFDKAVDDLSVVIKRDPKKAPAYNSRAWSEIALGRYDNALQDANKSLQLDPNSAETLDTRGLVFFCLRDYQKAMIDYEHGISLKPEDGACHFHLALVFNKFGEELKAKREFQFAKELNYTPELWEMQILTQKEE